METLIVLLIISFFGKAVFTYFVAIYQVVGCG
ncbi:hypothetical protein SRABI80_03763 [Peribacillus frigoritolerans]|nr:hypothetical protein SRABI80_03763 [Peribacillus frigoritolerans]